MKYLNKMVQEKKMKPQDLMAMFAGLSSKK